MKLSTRGRYGVSAIYDIALHCQEGPVSLRLVAERQGISEHYLEQLIGQLRKAGLVKGVRGAQGGYTLAKAADKITVGDVVRIMEGPLVPVKCLLSTKKGDKHYCENSSSCVTRNVWAKVGDSIAKVLDGITLADLCKDSGKDVK